ncbi:hypothetical protein Q7C36_014341 [Tachysurus vachellii]|uniref:Uncharacterized protein n=1 Tax=Tachysurus vachellii TaxID=175792 RepID=A0AA88SG44_TACVA|nr:hypothetical protein Q7C36_014341 [Tachysurus vachellii]
MLRLLHHCLIAVSLAGSLMLLPLCCADIEVIQLETEYDSTPLPDYDYNATFDYSFYSNSSTEELERFFKEKETEADNRGLDITDPPSTVSTVSNEAFKTVYSSLLLMLILAAHQLLRLL